MSRFLVANKNHALLNSVPAAVLYGAYGKLGMSKVFNGRPWLEDLKQVWRLVLCSIKRGRLLFKDHMLEMTGVFCLFRCGETTLPHDAVSG